MTLDRHGFAALGPIYDAAMDESRWREALDAVSAASGGIGGALLGVEREDNPYSIRAVGGAYAAMTAADMRHYAEHLSHLEAGEWQALAAARVREILIDSDVADPAVLDRRADYRYLREKAGVGRRFGVRLNENPAWYDAMTVVFDSRDPAVAAGSRARLAPLLPHLAMAVEMGRPSRGCGRAMPLCSRSSTRCMSGSPSPAPPAR